MTSIIKKVCIFLIGGIGYGVCELLWRGYTHWTMVILGGTCMIAMYGIEKKYKTVPLNIRCICGGVFICSLELIAGSVINIALGMAVWDYSSVPFNFLGQVCLPFLLLWILLCIPALAICDYIAYRFDEIYV